MTRPDIVSADCPFCVRIHSGEHDASNDAAVAFCDAFPVCPEHTLVVPRRHVASLYDLDDADLLDVWRLVTEVRAHLASTHRPDGFTIGVNDGVAAGQTVPHAHVHVIPRHVGDVPDPRGGIRWVLPQMAAYWKR